MNRPELLQHADAIEIQLGQGAQAAAAMKTRPTSDKMINARMREVFGLDPAPAVTAPRFACAPVWAAQPQEQIHWIRQPERR